MSLVHHVGRKGGWGSREGWYWGTWVWRRGEGGSSGQLVGGRGVGQAGR